MKMHVLSGGRLRMKKSIYIPGSDRSEMIELPVNSVLLRHAQGNVLFDTGCHPSVVDDAESRWGGMARVMTPIMGPGDNVISGLAAMGLLPEDIDVVVNSHFHADHCGCNAYFRKATIVVHAEEMKAARAPDSATRGYLPVEWDHPMLVDEVTAQRDLFGDGRIVLVPLPGHTPGTMGALATLDKSGAFLLASDAVSLRVSLDQDIIPKNTWNVEVLTATLQEIRRIERGGATVICSHDAAQWEQLKKGVHAYE